MRRRRSSGRTRPASCLFMDALPIPGPDFSQERTFSTMSRDRKQSIPKGSPAFLGVSRSIGLPDGVTQSAWIGGGDPSIDIEEISGRLRRSCVGCEKEDGLGNILRQDVDLERGPLSVMLLEFF